MKSKAQSKSVEPVPAEKRRAPGESARVRSRTQEVADLRARVLRAKAALEDLEEAQIVEKATLELEFTV